MIWRFTLLDRNQTATVIDEPVGWDGIEFKLSRDKTMHGIFYDYQTNSFEFWGKAMALLSAEYETYGVQGIFWLKAEYDCDENGVFVLFYCGALLFGTYDKVCGDDCYVKISMDNIAEVVQLKNNMQVSVDLRATKCFDQVTDIIPYRAMPVNIVLPSKAILLTNLATTTVDPVNPDYRIDQDADYNNVAVRIDPTGFPSYEMPTNNGFIIPKIDNSTSTELDTFSPSYESDYVTKIQDSPIQIIPATPVEPTNTYNISLRYKGTLTIKYYANGQTEEPNNQPGELASTYVHAKLWAALKYGKSETDVFPPSLLQDFTDSIIADTQKTQSLDFDFAWSGSISLNSGDAVWACLPFSLVTTTTMPVVSPIQELGISFTTDTFFKIQSQNKANPSTADVFLINETFSRLAESITNNQLKVYSDYFGRTDSQPYAVAADGCGSKEAITNGLCLRNVRNTDGSKPSVFLNLQDFFADVSAIHNIGMGVEKFTNNIASDDITDDLAKSMSDDFRLRIEPWKWFYKNTVILTLKDVNTIEKTVQPDLHLSIFRVGYDKWEAQESNGLDEFLTKREFHTLLTQVSNVLEQISKLIASGYAIEVTRRQGATSTDWQYDNDNFIICLEKTDGLVALAIFGTGFLVGSNHVISLALNVNQIQAGSVITITGSKSNNGVYHVTAVTPADTGCSITVIETVVPELALVGIAGDGLATFSVELNNITGGTNIVDPPTVYNYRISPMRNLMRWFGWIAASYRVVDPNALLVFSSGDGNVLAQGELTDSDCRLENGVIAENHNLSINNFANVEDALPIMRFERDVFTYPLSTSDFKLLRANPYGLIAYSNQNQSGEGWIDTVDYKPTDGTAKFTLIPKIIY